MRKGLTKAEQERFRKLILKRRETLRGNVSRMQDQALRSSRQEASGDLSSMPIHGADQGTDHYEQEFTLGLIESEEEELREIDKALKRIEEGLFGLCEECEKPIPKARLSAIPYARLCVKCQHVHDESLEDAEE